MATGTVYIAHSHSMIYFFVSFGILLCACAVTLCHFGH